MREVVVIGVGMVRFQRYRDRELTDFGREAVVMALQDAGMPLGAVQAAYCGARGDVGIGPGPRVLKTIGGSDMPVVNVEAASASGGAAFREAYLQVAAEIADVTLAFGVGKNSTPVGHLGGASPQERLLARATGLLPAAGDWAMELRLRDSQTGCSEEACVRIAVKAHANGSRNPMAHRNREITADEVRQSKMICDPLTAYHCCPASDGAAAVVLGSRKVADRLGIRPIVTVAASESLTDLGGGSERVSSRTVTQRSYAKASLGPEDIDLVQCYNSFSVQELVQYEDLGFANEGEGERLIFDGETEIGGRIPFATDGGNLARGHAVGPTGIAQVWETVLQLRGCAGARQVDGARVGLIHQLGYSGEALSHVLVRN
jgi:acetyl-CoA acetyltransferase